MITIVCSTNRNNSLSFKISTQYQKLLAESNEESQIVDLYKLPADYIVSGLYENAGKNEVFNSMQDMIKASEKVVFIVPEYNGSFPGVLKAFIDGMSYPNPLKGKKGALVGLSSGIQGAGLALSHLSDILNYCGMHVLALKPKLAHIEKNIDVEFKITNELYQSLLEQQVKDLIKF